MLYRMAGSVRPGCDSKRDEAPTEVGAGPIGSYGASIGLSPSAFGAKSWTSLV
jgi:hypothetical protein